MSESFYGRSSKGPETIRELIKELEAATEGSELFDAMIVRVICGWWTDFATQLSGAGDQGGSSPIVPFTRSLDAKIDFGSWLETTEDIERVELHTDGKWEARCHGFTGLGNTEPLARRIAALEYIIQACEMFGHKYSNIGDWAIGRCRHCGELDFAKIKRQDTK